MLSFECIKNEKSVYFLLTSADRYRKVRYCDNSFNIHDLIQEISRGIYTR